MDKTENQDSARYDAFISYSRRDSEFARRLEKALDNYKPPKIPGVEQRRLKIFRDENDLIGADYGEAIEKNIRDSKKLILICSPNSAGSSYVNDEIQRFAIKKGAANLIPILISGLPSNEVKKGEENLNAFPKALTDALEMPLAIDYRNSNIKKHKINGGILKGSWYSILARILDVNREQVEERDRYRQRKKNRIILTTTFLIISIVFAAFSIALSKSMENAELKLLDRNYTLAKSYEIKAGQAMDNQSYEGYKKAWLYTLAALSQVDTSRDMSLSRGRLSRNAISFGAGINQKIWISPCPPGRQNAIAISLPRSLIAMAADDGQIHLLNFRTGESIYSWRAHDDEIIDLDFDPDGNKIASCGTDGKVICWDLAENNSGIPKPILHKTKLNPYGITFNEDGNRLFALIQDSLFSFDTGKRTWWWKIKSVFQSERQPLILPAGSLDLKGKIRPTLLANQTRTQIDIGLPDGSLCSVDAEDWKFILKKQHLSDVAISGLAISNDGEKIFAASLDGTIQISSVKNSDIVPLFKSEKSILHLSLNPPGNILAGGMEDGTIVLWSQTSDSNWIFVKKIAAHSDSVNQIQFLSDSLLLSAGSDGILQIWQVPEGKRIAITSGHQSMVNTVAFSPRKDTTLLASGDDDGLVIIWDKEGRERQRLFRKNQIIESLAFDTKGEKIASGTKAGSVYIWDVKTGSCIDSLTKQINHIDRVWDIAFSPTDSLIAIAMDRSKKNLYLWNVKSRSLRPLPDTQKKGLKCLKFTHDGKYLVTGSRDSSLCLWNVENGEPIRRWPAHTDEIYGVDISRNDSLIASASKDETICFWDLKTILKAQPEEDILPVRRLKQHFAEVWDVNFSPDGKILASGSADQTIRIWSVESGVEMVALQDHNRDVFSVAFSPDGSELASGSFDNTVGVWDVKNCVNLDYLISSKDTVSGIAYSHDGKYFAYGGLDKRLHMYPVEQDRDCIATLKPKNIRPKFWDWSGILSISFSPDNKHLAYGSRDNRIRLWDYNAENKIMLLGHDGDGLTVDFSGDSLFLASGSSDNMVRIWKMDSVLAGNTKEWEELKKHQDKIRCVKFSHSSKLLATGASDKSIFVWKVDPETKHWSFVRALQGHSDGIWSLDFNSRDEVLASGSWDGTIRLWQVKSGRKLATFRGPGGPVLSVLFENDSTLISGYYDGAIRIWDLETGQEIEKYRLHSGPLYTIALSPQDSFLTTGSADRTIRLTELLEKTTSLENLKQSDFKQLYDIFAASLNYRLDAGFLKETNQFSFTPVNGYQFPDSGLYYASILKNRPLGINPLNWLINEIKQKDNN